MKKILDEIQSSQSELALMEIMCQARLRMGELRNQAPSQSDDNGQPNDAWYIQQAHGQYHDDGEIEIDDNAIVSRGGDDGAYVEAWVWVYDQKEEEEE